MGKLRKLTPYILRQWRSLALIALLTAINSAVAAFQPWPMKLLVDYALKQEAVPSSLDSLLAVLRLPASPMTLLVLAAAASIVLYAIYSALDAGLTWLWSVAGQRMVHALSVAMFERLQRCSISYHQRHGVGDSLSRLSGDAWCIYSLTSQFFSPGEQIFTLLTIGAVAWQLNPRLAVISLAAAPVLALVTIYFGRKMKLRRKQSREAESRLLSFVHQTLSAMPVVQAFSTERQNSLRFQDLAEDAVALSQRGSLVTRTYGMATGLVTTAGAALVLFLGGLEVLSGRLSLGSLLVFLAYVRRMQSAAEGLLKTYGSYKPVEASIDRVLEVLEPDPDEVRDLPGARRLGRDAVRGHVSLESVVFGYESGRPVLRGVDLEAHPGETIGLVGATGAGKSTLVSMIPRFFDPWSGRVTLDGEDVRALELTSLREQVAVVLQEPFLFPHTVAENIAYGRLDATREEIERAAVLANADAFIRRLPQGYDTLLGQRGATLSGGEQQRLSIARALLKDAPILILDEPTSALDTGTERLLIEALERLMEGRTTFVIAHRLSTIRRATRIVVLEQGRVAEQGTHDELRTSGGLYERLHRLQCEGAGREAVA